MAVKSSGSLSFATDIVGEFPDTAPHSLSEFYGVAAGIPSSGQIKFSDFYGASGSFSPTGYAYTEVSHYSQDDTIERFGPLTGEAILGMTNSKFYGSGKNLFVPVIYNSTDANMFAKMQKRSFDNATVNWSQQLTTGSGTGFVPVFTRPLYEDTSGNSYWFVHEFEDHAQWDTAGTHSASTTDVDLDHRRGVLSFDSSGSFRWYYYIETIQAKGATKIQAAPNESYMGDFEFDETNGHIYWIVPNPKRSKSMSIFGDGNNGSSTDNSDHGIGLYKIQMSNGSELAKRSVNKATSNFSGSGTSGMNSTGSRSWFTGASGLSLMSFRCIHLSQDPTDSTKIVGCWAAAKGTNDFGPYTTIIEFNKSDLSQSKEVCTFNGIAWYNNTAGNSNPGTDVVGYMPSVFEIANNGDYCVAGYTTGYTNKSASEWAYRIRPNSGTATIRNAVTVQNGGYTSPNTGARPNNASGFINPLDDHFYVKADGTGSTCTFIVFPDTSETTPEWQDISLYDTQQAAFNRIMRFLPAMPYSTQHKDNSSYLMLSVNCNGGFSNGVKAGIITMNGDFSDEGNINITNRIQTNNSTTGSLGFHAWHDVDTNTGYFGSGSYFTANTNFNTTAATDTNVLVTGTTVSSNPFTISTWTPNTSSTHYVTDHDTF